MTGQEITGVSAAEKFVVEKVGIIFLWRSKSAEETNEKRFSDIYIFISIGIFSEVKYFNIHLPSDIYIFISIYIFTDVYIFTDTHIFTDTDIFIDTCLYRCIYLY